MDVSKADSYTSAHFYPDCFDSSFFSLSNVCLIFCLVTPLPPHHNERELLEQTEKYQPESDKPSKYAGWIFFHLYSGIAVLSLKGFESSQM